MIRSRRAPFGPAIDAAVNLLARVLAAPLGMAAAGRWAYPPGASPGENGRVTGAWSAAPCPAGQCRGRNGACGPCLVFVSSSEHMGNLGGLAGADAICQGLAQAAGLPGTYRAWLSTGSVSPATRFNRATVPYTLVDGTVIALNWADLTSGSLRHAIDQAETGRDVTNPGDTAWSNTLTDGTPAGSVPKAHCQDWTAAASGDDDGHVGIPFSTYEDWSYTGTRMYCVFPQRLYCFQQP